MLSYSIGQTSKMTGICRTSLYEQINKGTLKCRKMGRKTLILKSDLDAFLSNLESYSSNIKEG